MRDSASRPLFLPYATGKTCRLGLENHSPLMQRCICFHKIEEMEMFDYCIYLLYSTNMDRRIG